MSASAFGKITGLLASGPANLVTASIESNRSSVTNSTSSPFSRMNNSAPRYPPIFRAAMLGKISSRSNFSYGFASSGLVHPCQMRAIIEQSRIKTERKRKRCSHSHYLVAAINIDDLAGDGCRGVASEKNSRSAQFGGVAAALQRCAFLIMLQHGRETADAASGQRLHRAS